MSFTIESGKEAGPVQANVTPRPLILCQIVAIDGDTVWLTSTPDLGADTKSYGGNTYQARLQSNVIDQIQAQSPQGYDIPGSINLQIADGDYAIWRSHANAHGWRGGTLTVLFVLWDAPSNAYSTNAYLWTFILDKPNTKKGVITVAAQARQSMTRLNVPNFARQNRCGQTFPANAAQRLDGLTNPTSMYYGCGYSPDLISIGGVGNTSTPNLTNPDGSALTDASGYYVMCDYTRSDKSKTNTHQGCMARLGNYAATVFYGTSTPCGLDGDILHDQAGRNTGRFTGDTWLAPVGWQGKEYDNPSAGTQYGFNATNPPTGATNYNLGYGEQWVNATVLEPFSDPNFYSAECIVCMAPVGSASIIKVLVNGVDVPLNGSDSQFTYRIMSTGGRNGVVSNVPILNGQGDPHGSMCWILIGVPRELQTSGSIATVQVLVQFPPPLQALPIASAASSGSDTVLTFTGENESLNFGRNVYISGNSGIPDGAYPCIAATTGPPGTATISGISVSGTGGGCFFFPSSPDGSMIDSKGAAAANPVWVLMDLLSMWGPFTIADFDVQAWWNAAEVCKAQISYTDLNGNAATHARYRCSLVLADSNRQSLAKAVLGIRNCAGIMLARNPLNGLLQCYIEQTLADQQPSAIAGSNYNTPVASVTAAGAAANGYLAYLFDGAGSIEEGTFELQGRSLNDTPNTVSFAFQDSANQWVQDSITTIDPNGYVSAGNQEIQAQIQMLGIENFDQGTRRANVELAKALYGNTRFDSGGSEFPVFRTTVKAAHLASRVGYICGINYEQLGL